MSIANRIKEIRISFDPKLTQADFGAQIGMSRDNVANLENERVEPSDAILKLICMTYDINWDWLKNGEGEMKNPPDTADEMVDRIMTGDENFKKSVFRAFAKLGDEEWEALKRFYEAIKKECE